MDPATWDRIQAAARSEIRARAAAQDQRVAAQARVAREAQRPNGAPRVGYVANLLEHRCPRCEWRFWIEDKLAKDEHACSGCDYVGVFEPREDQ